MVASMKLQFLVRQFLSAVSCRQNGQVVASSIWITPAHFHQACQDREVLFLTGFELEFSGRRPRFHVVTRDWNGGQTIWS